MTRKVRAILIDPFACTVTDVELDASHLDNLHRQLSHEVHPVRSLALAYCPFLRVGEAIYVDNQGSLKGPVRFFLRSRVYVLDQFVSNLFARRPAKNHMTARR